MIKLKMCPICGEEVKKITYTDSTGKRKKTRYIRMCSEPRWMGIRYVPIEHIRVSSKIGFVADIKWNAACRRILRMLKQKGGER